MSAWILSHREIVAWIAALPLWLITLQLSRIAALEGWSARVYAGVIAGAAITYGALIGLVVLALVALGAPAEGRSKPSPACVAMHPFLEDCPSTVAAP